MFYPYNCNYRARLELGLTRCPGDFILFVPWAVGYEVGLDDLGIVDLQPLVLTEGEVHSRVLISGTDNGVDLDATRSGEGELKGQKARGVLAHIAGGFEG